MEEIKVFCENCRTESACVIESREMTGTIHGVKYQYEGREARCSNCGEIVYVPMINDENLSALYSVYRNSNGIVSLEDVQSIPKKYNIGKRPLSLLLGWGEQTLSRYLDGDVPSRQYSEILKKLANDPVYYLDYLETNKEKLQSEVTYRKSKKAAEELIGNNSHNSKIDSVIAYILNQCQDITPLALQKALYYIQGFYYAFFEKFLFSEDFQAWAHGPVNRNIYARYANYHFDPISNVSKFDSSVFTAQEKSVIDSVIKNICCYSGKVLERFTHNEKPWLLTRGDILDSAPSDRIIEKRIIGEYFCDVKKKYNMVVPGDIRSYSLAMFDSL